MLKERRASSSQGWRCKITTIPWIGLLCFPLIAADDFASKPLHLRARSGSELDSLIATHIRTAEVTELREKKMQTDRGLALAAAWEIVRRTISKGGGETPDPKIALGRFVGFVEGRLGVEIPEFWERSILTAEVTIDGLPCFKQANGYVPYREFVTADKSSDASAPIPNMVSPREASVLSEGDELHILLGHQRLTLPSAVGKSLGYPYNRICTLMTSEHVYVALHPVSGYGYDLVCFSRDHMATRWTCHVWGYGEFLTNGDKGHWVALFDNVDELLVFGMSDSNAYIQGFRKTDGSNTLRFGTVYGMNFCGPRTKK